MNDTTKVTLTFGMVLVSVFGISFILLVLPRWKTLVRWLYKLYTPPFVYFKGIDEQWWYVMSFTRLRSGEFRFKLQKEGGQRCRLYRLKLTPGTNEYNIIRGLFSAENVAKGIYVRFPLVDQNAKIPFVWDLEGDGVNVHHLNYRLRLGIA